MTARSIPALAGWVAAAFLAAAVGSIPSTDVYQSLDLPAWAPPSYLFAPVWTALYLMMGIAAWLVWSERYHADINSAIALFVVQLVLNALWTWIFFGFGAFSLAVVEIALLWIVLQITAVQFWRVKPAAGALLIPYLAWVTYATALTVAIWRAN